MAGIQEDISLRIKNNLNREAKLSILGGTQDPSNGQANAKTIYEWDLSSETFTNITVVSIQASTIDNPTSKIYQVANQDGLITNIETIARLLNTLNLGVFNYTGSTLWIIDDINVFGNLETKVSTGFDIDNFVESAYNYFDSENKTSLSSFSSLYKPLIEEAINTIPNFVNEIQSNGWQLAYVTQASEVELIKDFNDNIWVVTNNNSVFDTIVFTGSNPVNSSATDGMLIFTKNIQTFIGQQTLEANDDGTALIYKYIFKGITRFFDNSSGDRGWLALDSSYFTFGNELTDLVFELDTVQNLDLYGNSFPNIGVNNNQRLLFDYPNNATQAYIELGNQTGDAEINFGDFGNDSRLILNRISSQNNVINLNFSTLSPLLSKLRMTQFNIFFGGELNSNNTINIDSSFNTKFDKDTISQNGGNFLLIFLATGGFITGRTTLIYQDDITPIKLNFQLIDFSLTYTENLPPIDLLGSFTGTNNFSLDLNLNSQQVPSNITMRYFNDWLFKLGTQDFIYDTAVFSGSASYNFTNNNFTPSGEGLVGLTSILQKNISTVNLPSGTIPNGYGSFIVKKNNNATARIEVVGESLPILFDVKYSEKNEIDVNQQSLGGQIDLLRPNPAENQNIIFTNQATSTLFTDPIQLLSIYSSVNLFDVFEGLLFGNGAFAISGTSPTFEIQGLSLELSEISGEFNRIGLFKRDFSGLVNFTTLLVRYFKITTTDISSSPNLFPNGSKAIFNILDTSSISEFILLNAEIGTANGLLTIDNNTTAPLDVFFDAEVLFTDSITFEDVNFNFGANNINGNCELEFEISSESLEPALLGTTQFSNVSFSSVSNDRVVLLFDSSYTGTGNVLDNFILNDSDVSELILRTPPTTPPSGTNINISGVSLEVLNFQDYGLTVVTIGLNSINLLDINVDGNSLDSTGLDALLFNVNDIGSSNGTLSYQNQTTGASPNIGVSGTAYNQLISRGWTILGNPPV